MDLSTTVLLSVSECLTEGVFRMALELCHEQNFLTSKVTLLNQIELDANASTCVPGTVSVTPFLSLVQRNQKLIKPYGTTSIKVVYLSVRYPIHCQSITFIYSFQITHSQGAVTQTLMDGAAQRIQIVPSDSGLSLPQRIQVCFIQCILKAAMKSLFSPSFVYGPSLFASFYCLKCKYSVLGSRDYLFINRKKKIIPMLGGCFFFLLRFLRGTKIITAELKKMLFLKL